ncbi:universal stress protein [Streptomyces sp. AM8-1-1]|uniref:universal stress protein n=1 Tax=Streptomyces sp. AM8-1-1 TaxID=3075825 RepID=UPI0028C418B6|nr:universal stress protein [Streptomyces sp. AM8-1-1]WNO70269.1 universal stress protein [Streptomyces sp. AM8-1-1]
MSTRVVVGVDGSAGSAAAVEWAAAEATARGAALRIVRASPLRDQDMAGLWPYRPGPLPAQVLKTLAERHRGLSVECRDLTGPTVATLVAQSENAELVVVSTRGTGGFPGLSLGSVARGVAERSVGPLVLVPNAPPEDRIRTVTGRVVLGVDACDPAGPAIEFSLRAARRAKGSLHAIHAWSLPAPAADWMPFAVPEEDRGRWEDHQVQLLSDALRPWREKYPRALTCWKTYGCSGPRRRW